MATLRNKRELAASNKENCEDHLRSNLGQNSSVFRSKEDYRTQVFEEIERRVKKKLSQEFSKPDVSERIWHKPGTIEDESQGDPHLEASIVHDQTTQNTGPEDGHDMVTNDQSS